MSATVSGIVIGLFTGIVTTIAGAAVWTYYLKGKIDARLEKRLERKEQEEQIFQERVKEVMQHPLMEADYTIELFGYRIEKFYYYTITFIFFGLFIYLATELVNNIFSEQVYIGYLVAMMVWTIVVFISFNDKGDQDHRKERRIANVISEARRRQAGRLPNPVKHLEVDDSTKQ